MSRPMCRHCGKRIACRPKRLCYACSTTPEIRNSYPGATGSHNAREQTLEELEAMIAERYATMPQRGNDE